jgi:hypothetical protein
MTRGKLAGEQKDSKINKFGLEELDHDEINETKKLS